MKRKREIIIFLLTAIIITISLVYRTKAAESISRQEAQDRAYKMAYTTWHYSKSLNGRITSYIKSPDHLKDKIASEEIGIPYNYGGSDGIDTSSNIQWSNFFDAITKGATAGNVKFSGGYKGETAGIDAASFIQSTLKISGNKLTTNTIGQYLTPISFEDLRNMDVLLSKGDHVAFFQSWIYDELGEVMGASTIEATYENNDGTGQKVKEYYRPKNYVMDNYKAYRYEGIANDYIESNSTQPTIESPLYRQSIDKSSDEIQFNWHFNDTSSGVYQAGYRIRIYKGDIDDSSDLSGVLVTQVSEASSSEKKTIDFKDMAEGNYHFILETKNNKGYWSTPLLTPFRYVSDAKNAPSKIKEIVRFGGVNRYETSKIIAAENFKYVDLKNVVIASGNDFPDGLSGVTLARRLNSPLLLVDKSPQDEGSKVILDYILNTLKKDGKIYILGGEGAVSNSFVEYLTQSGYLESNIIRVGGLNRHETSVNIAKTLNLSKGTSIVLANDSLFADALSISSKAGSSQMPVLLTSRDMLSEEVERYIRDIKPSKVFILGETGAISEGVRNRVMELAGLNYNQTVRLGGQTRYETSEKINSYFYGNELRNVYVANGQNFPDSLSGSAAAAFNNGAPLILVSNTSYINGVRSLNNLTGNNKVILNIFGGDKIVTNYLISKIDSAAMKLK